SAEENRELVRAMKAKLRPGGRLVLDVWNRRFFESRQGTRELRPDIVETSVVEDGRRRVRIDYGDESEEMDHELFTAEQLRELVGLPCVCERAADDDPRLLLVFAERGGWLPPHVYEEHYLAADDPRAQSGFRRRRGPLGGRAQIDRRGDRPPGELPRRRLRERLPA